MRRLSHTILRVIDVATVVLIVGTIGVAALKVAFLLPAQPSQVTSSITMPIGFAPSTVAPLDSKTLGPGTLESSSGSLRFHVSPRTALVAQMVALLIAAVALILFVRLLRGVFAALDRGEPFADDVTRRVRWLGLGVVALYTSKAIVGLAIWAFLNGNLTTGRLPLYPSGIDPLGLFVGFAIIALAEAFRYGSQLRAESELTV